MDLDAVRTFVAVVDAGRFQEAAANLSITQQAVSKRIAALEQSLGVSLFTRKARRAQLTIDGQVFLPYARDLLRAEERASNSVRPGQRALRVDVINPRIAPAHLIRDFHRAYPETELTIVTHILDASSAIAAVQSGAIDVTFRALTIPTQQLAEGLEAVRILDEPIQLVVGPAHKLAASSSVAPADLVAHKVWMPNLPDGTEWTAFYHDLGAAFGFSIDAIGPNFGTDAILEVIAGSSTLATLMGEQTRLVWPSEYDLRRIPLRNPTPLYPHSLIWRGDSLHPVLGRLCNYLRPKEAERRDGGIWTPKWAQRPTSE